MFFVVYQAEVYLRFFCFVEFFGKHLKAFAYGINDPFVRELNISSIACK